MVFGRLTARAATRNDAIRRGWATRRRGSGGAITGPLPPEPEDEQALETEAEAESVINRFSAPRLSQVIERKGPVSRAFERVSLAVERRSRPRPPKTRNAVLFDRMLLALEIAGALIVAWLAFQYIYTVYFDKGTPRRLSASAVVATQTARALGVAATPMATPTLFAEVAPPETGGPGDAESGTGAGPAVEPTPTPVPPPAIDPELLLPNRLRIPVMFLDSPVHEVEVNIGEWDVSPLDVGHHRGTGDPGQVGNVVLAAHRDINSALFRELDRLGPGDEVFVYNALGEYRYIVQESFVVSPDDTEVMEPTGDKRVTLITCTPIGLATQRLIVVATLDESYSAGP